MTDLIDDLVALRLRTLSRHQGARTGEATKAAVRDLVTLRLAAAGEQVATFYRGAELVAVVLLAPEHDSYFGCEVVHCWLDFAPGDDDACHWIADALAALSPRFDERFNLNLDAAYGALLGPLRALGLHVASLILNGDPRVALSAVAAGGPPPTPPDVEARPLRATAHVDAIIDLKRREFGRHPELGWFLAGEGYLSAERTRLCAALEADPTTRFVLLHQGAPRGYFGFELQPANPYWGCAAGMDLVFGEAIRGRGLATIAYAHLLGEMIGLGVEVFRGGTSNPAVIHLARRMGRPLAGWELRHGPSPFSPGHFDYPEPATPAGRSERMKRESHWNQVYESKPTERVSWYTPHLSRSLELISEAGPPANAAFIDVGGGASTLPADLLDRGFADLTVLDVSPAAVAQARAHLGERADQVRWVVGDVTTAPLPAAAYDVWHDRAVFHFLTHAADRAAYVRQVTRALRPGGHLIVATFGPNGPEKCSGLPVVRYDPAALQAQLGAAFERLRDLEETHLTPWGGEQSFVYCLWRRTPTRERGCSSGRRSP